MSRNFSFAFNWQDSTPHLLYLNTFLKVRPAGEHPIHDEKTWHALLKEPPEKALQRFQAHGVVATASLYERLDYQCTVPELIALLRTRDLRTGGRKDELISRLISHTGEQIITELPHIELVRCTDRGRQIAEQFWSGPDTLTRLSEHRYIKIAIAVLTFLIVQGIIAGVVGNAAYDLLKMLAGQTGEDISKVKKPGRFGRSTRLAPGVNIEWCYVPAGHFWMGSADNDSLARDDEKPRHRVYLDAFYIAKYPVTNRQYQVFVHAAGYQPPYGWAKNNYPAGEGDHPVRYVYWKDAVAFCTWAARRTGVPIRLLTEAEWEKACRGTDGRRWPWGDRWRMEWTNVDNRIGKTTPVGNFPRGASPYGVQDMIGNVWEWTSSIYKPYPYYAGDGREDMTKDEWRVIRGGSYYSGESFARAASRDRAHWRRWDDYGCRVGCAAPFSPPSVL